MTAGEEYRLTLPDGTVFTSVDGRSLFTLDEARLYARWMGGTVTPASPAEKSR